MSEPSVPVQEEVYIDGIMMPRHPYGIPMLDHINSLRSMTLRDDDIFICAYPKTGTHWLWEVCHMLMKGKVDYETRKKENAMIDAITIDKINAESSPRIFNTHLHMSMLPWQQMRDKRTKVVHVYRNPKDLVVSMLFHIKQYSQFADISLEALVQGFIKGEGVYGSYIKYLKQMEKYITDNPDLPIINLSFEETKRNTFQVVKRLADFLEVGSSDQLCQDIAEACSFQKMAEASKTKTGLEGTLFSIDAQMFRKGVVGDWKTYLTVAQSEAIDELFAREMKDNSFFKMEYTL